MTSFNKLTSLFTALVLMLVALSISPSKVRATEASLKFSPPTVSTYVGSQFSTNILLDTSGYSTGGVGAIINYDPDKVIATSIETTNLFADYPISSINNEDGIITISGIVASPNHLYRGTDTFAVVNFYANSTGATTISFEHELGSTTDSNIAVTFGTGDVLTTVNSLKVRINSGQAQDSDQSMNPLALFKSISINGIKHKFTQLIASINFPFIQNKFASTRDGRSPSKKLNPLDPLVSQQPITDPLNTQPETNANEINSLSATILNPFLLAIVLLVVVAAFIVFFSLRRIFELSQELKTR